MRVYLPLDPAALDAEEFAPGRGYAVTGALAAALPEEDDEGHEASAYLAACDAAVDLAGPGGRRLVLAADVPDRETRVPGPAGGEAHPGLVELASAVPWRTVASLHIDEATAIDDVRAAAAGDAAAVERVAERDLLWYHPTERAIVLAELRSGA